ncbi:hypothetical protein [Streptomyces sp. NPDC049916]|uniref:hypothetical protein n=1 Tax=Streptomyces sp. NPDC049916 TaxID=3155156 RepID=UPI00342E0AB9
MTLLLAACTGATGDAESDGASGTENHDAPQGSGPSSGADSGNAPSADAPNRIDPDPTRLPKTRAAALDLIGRVIAGPDSFGPGVVARSPYESGPATWPVLGADCFWRQQPPGDQVLATVTRSFEVPAEAGKGPLRLAAVVTVHRTRQDAAREMAESIEESMRCPTQQLREGERIGSLVAGALLGGEANQTNSEDLLSETGEYRSAELGGPHPYAWQQAQILQATVAVTGKGAKGRTAREVDSLITEAQAAMLVRLEDAVEKQS